MPSRLIREGLLTSENVNQLDASGERFFVRLMLKADDFGGYTAHPQLLKASLFPLRDDVRSTDISRWLAACEKAGLVRCYSVSGKEYLEVLNFNQKLRAKKRRYPEAPKQAERVCSACLASDPQMYCTCPPEEEEKKRREDELEEEGEGQKVGANKSRPAPLSDSEWLESLKKNQTYSGIDVGTEFGKASEWVAVNPSRKFSRRFFINWLNRIERPINGVHHQQGKPNPRNFGIPATDNLQLALDRIAHDNAT